MNQRYIVLFFVLIIAIVFGYSQDTCSLTLSDLQKHLHAQTCELIANDLKTCQHVKDGHLQYNVGLCHSRNHADSLALLSFLSALDMNYPRPGFVHMQLARCYARMQADDKAIAELKAAQSYAVPLYPWFEDVDLLYLKDRNAEVARMYEEVKPSFDSWTMFFVPFILLGLLQVLAFRFWKNNYHPATQYLAALILVFCITMTSYILYWTNYNFDFPYMQSWWHVLYYLIGPLYFLYVKGVFSNYGAKSVGLKYIHFIPFVIVFVLLIPWHVKPFDVLLNWPSWMIFIGSHFVFKLVHLAVYFVAAFLHAKNDMQIDDNIRVWTQVILVMFGLFLSANIAYFSLVNWSGFNVECDYFISGIMCLSILSIGMIGLVQPKVFRSVPLAVALTPIKYKSSSLTPAASLSLKQSLESLMLEQQVYKENELRLNDLASYLQTNKHHVSQVINEHYKVSFFEFINKYRVMHVTSKLEDAKYDKETIIQLAYEAGFNNKVSFNKAFKLVHGMTPSMYRKSKGDERRQKKLAQEN